MSVDVMGSGYFPYGRSDNLCHPPFSGSLWPRGAERTGNNLPGQVAVADMRPAHVA